MEDRFKFRAWNKIKQSYDYDVQECKKIPLSNSNKEKCFACFQSYLDNQDILEIEQCTGLKDKSSKLIYEGDVVEYHVIATTSFIMPKEKLVLKTRKVTFKKGYFSPVFNLDLNDVKIIGNIHENPELLEENND